MTRTHQASRLNISAFAQEGLPLSGSALLQNMERLAPELQGLQPDLVVNWQANAEFRAALADAGSEPAIWLHLTAAAAVPLTCQRCMTPVEVPVEIDQWYRFVATEDIAMAEDDLSDEDLLVMEPHFDLLALLEDELLMAVPLVPMHAVCPGAASAGHAELPEADAPEEKPNPFAVLQQLKTRK